MIGMADLTTVAPAEPTAADLGIDEAFDGEASHAAREAHRDASRVGASDPLAGLPERIKAEGRPELARDPVVVNALVELEEIDAPEFTRVCRELRTAGVRAKDLDTDLRRRRAERKAESKAADELRRAAEAAARRAARMRVAAAARAEGEARSEPVPSDPSSAWAEGEWTDLGNTERMVRGHGADFRYCARQNSFYCWDGTRWRREGDEGAVMRFAKATVGRFMEEATDDHARKWATKSQAVKLLSAMVHLAKSNQAVQIEPDNFDADPWLLNCLNGTLDLRTRELRPHRREDLITKCVSASYDPSAEAPRFRRFLEEVLPNPAVRAYVLRHLGYSLTGVIREHAIVFHHGGGRNGKGTLIAVILHLLADYATAVPTAMLMAKKHDAHPADRMMLMGARLAVASEPEEGRALDTAVVKLLTGGDTIVARGMNENFIKFRPTHKLCVLCNPKPVIEEQTRAIWDRIHLTPWGVTFEGHQQDTTLDEKLRAEADGILRILVEACAEWQRDGLSPPDEVRAATQELRKENDEVGEFFDERCLVSSGREVKAAATALYKGYAAWCEAGGRRSMSPHAFGRQLMADPKRGVTKSKYAGISMYWGVRLLTEVERRERTEQAESNAHPDAHAAEGGTPPSDGELLGEARSAPEGAASMSGEDGEDGEGGSDVDPWSSPEVPW